MTTLMERSASATTRAKASKTTRVRALVVVMTNPLEQT